MKEFLKPLSKKDDIAFPEFCSLFKSKSTGDAFIKSLTGNTNNSNENSFNPNSGFPIQVRKKE